MTKHFTNAFDKSLDTMPSLLKRVGISAESFLGSKEVDAMRRDSVESLMRTTPLHVSERVRVSD